MNYLDFEKSVKDIDGKIEALQKAGAELNIDKIQKLNNKKQDELIELYSTLTAWDRVQVARHPDRPHTLDYIGSMVDGFIELCGDRMFADDQAIVGGIGRINGMPVMIIGEEKGDSTESRLKHNFGSPKPEGYRKAIRLVNLANKFGLPVVFFIDTAGAYPGAESEARGQSQAIASSIAACLDLAAPSVAVVIGEGGSGGAIAIAVANSLLMLSNSVYSVISPEGCASILWKDQDYKKQATKALKMTAEDLFGLGVIDGIIDEPPGGAHRHKEETMRLVKEAVVAELAKLSKEKGAKLRESRAAKFEKMTRV